VAVTRLLRSPVELPLESRPLPADDRASTTLNLEGIGTFPIESISTEVRQRRPKDREGKESTIYAAWHITKRHDGHSNALFRANLAGTEIPLAEVTLSASGQVVLRLRNAMITNFTTSSSSGELYESFTLEGEVVE
jgi:hypothetical protein